MRRVQRIVLLRRQRGQLREGDLHRGRPVREGRGRALQRAQLRQARPAPQQGKKAVQGFLDSVSSDTDKALTKLQAAGTPDVDNGQKISTTIVAAFKDLQTAIGSAS